MLLNAIYNRHTYKRILFQMTLSLCTVCCFIQLVSKLSHLTEYSRLVEKSHDNYHSCVRIFAIIQISTVTFVRVCLSINARKQTR